MTDDTRKVQPALTPEEWREMEFQSRYGIVETRAHIDHKGRLFFTGDWPDGREEGIVFNESYTDGPHKLAALCLYGQPFGFSQEDVDKLRALDATLTGLLEDHAAAPYVGDFDTGILASLADRIAALLPPAP